MFFISFCFYCCVFTSRRQRGDVLPSLRLAYRSDRGRQASGTLLSALTCSKEVWLLNRYLNMSIYPEAGVRNQDSYKVIGGIGGEVIGRYLAWDFLRNRWDELKEAFTGFASSYIGRIVKSISSSFNTEFDLEQLRDFQNSHSNEFGSSTRAVEQALEAVENNVKWMEDNYNVVAEWLNQRV